MKKPTRIKKRTIYRIILYTIFVVYLILLFKIVLFKYFSVSDMIRNMEEGQGFRSLNLIPFTTIKDFMDIVKDGGVLRGISNIFGNICVFAPLGYFLPLLFRPFQKTWKVLCAGLALSLAFECGQYFLYLGSADVDDVILNFIGVCVGNGCYYFIGRYAKNNYIKYRITIVLSAVCFIIALLVAGKEFGSILGLDFHKIVYEGQENIPDTDSDFGGTYLEIKDSVLYAYSGFVSPDSNGKSLLTVKEYPVTDAAKYVKQKIKEETWKTIISYEMLNEQDVKEIESYYGMLLWLDEEGKVDTVLFTDKIKNSGQVSVSEEKNEKNIWGDVRELEENGFVLNMGTDREVDGGSIAVIGNGDNMNLVNIKVTPETTYKKMIVHDRMGNDIDYEKAEWADLATGQTVDIKGYEENDGFVAAEIQIREYTF